MPTKENGQFELPPAILATVQETLRSAAIEGTLNQIDRSMFRRYGLIECGEHYTDGVGVNVFHLAAEYGHLNQIPEEFLTEAVVLTEAGNNGNVLHWAALHGHLDQIPQSLLTDKNLQTRTKADELDDGEGTVKGYTVGQATVIHIAALFGNLNQVPEAALTQSNLTKVCALGRTVFHAAASSGQLNQIPEELLTEANLLIRNKISGYTPLHTAAAYGSLAQIPKHVLTERNCLEVDSPNDPKTVLHIARDAGYLDQLLGLEFSDGIVGIVGEEWYAKNAEICRTRQQLAMDEAAADIDIF